MRLTGIHTVWQHKRQRIAVSSPLPWKRPDTSNHKVFKLQVNDIHKTIKAWYSIKVNGIRTVVNATDNATPTPIQKTGEPLQRLYAK